MNESQKIENEINMLKGLLQKETNLLKQGELTAKIKQLNDTLAKQRPSAKNPNLKANNKPTDLKSTDINANESEKISKDWDNLTRGKKK